MNREYWHKIGSRIVANEEAMLSKLLDENILFCNSRKYIEDKKEEEETIVLFVNANDIFYPAADAESITLKELPNLFRLYEEKGQDGILIWLCQKRNLQPWSRLSKRLKEDGRWDEKLDSLNKNIL